MMLEEIEIAGRRQALNAARQELVEAEADHARACADYQETGGQVDALRLQALQVEARRNRLRRVVEILSIRAEQPPMVVVEARNDGFSA
jgi:hypothetical protein